MAEARLRQIDTFLTGCGWGTATRSALAGDASARRYFRLHRAGGTAVLMDADPARGERVDRFLQVGHWLRAQGYSAPKVLAEEVAQGFLLLEDLGDDLVARLVAKDPGLERPLYLATTAFLADLHRHPPPDFLAAGDARALSALLGFVTEFYLPGMDAPVTDAALRIAPLVGDLFDRLDDGSRALSMRDFHAENLIWLPERAGVARAGLLDFQDAFATHPAYDLVSLLQDARRDVSLATEAACIAAYCGKKGLEQSRFLPIYALLGAQRALRILAIFARLSMVGGKPQYLAHAPRVWAALQRNLSHPALTDLARAVHEGLPEPTPERLQRIRQKCPTR